MDQGGLLDKYLNNNIDLAKAMNWQREQIAQLKDQVQEHCWLVFAMRDLNNENTALKAHIDKLQAELINERNKSNVWRTMMAELIKSNTEQFMKAVKMMSALPNRFSMVKQQTPADEANVENENGRPNQSMENKHTDDNEEEEKADVTITEKVNEVIASDKTSRLSSGLIDPTTTTADDIVEFLEETLTPSPLYPVVEIKMHDTQVEFSDDSVCQLFSFQPSVAVSNEPQNQVSIEIPKEADTESQPSPIRIASFEIPTRLGTPKIIVTEFANEPTPAEMTSFNCKPDDNYLKAPGAGAIRKRLPQPKSSFERRSSAFNEKSPRLSSNMDLNTSMTHNSSISSLGLPTLFDDGKSWTRTPTKIISPVYGRIRRLANNMTQNEPVSFVCNETLFNLKFLATSQ